MNTYLKIINDYKDKNVFILGAGPSLYYCIQDPFFKKLQKYGIVITVNSSIMAFKNCDIFISNDALVRRWSWYSIITNSKCIKIVRNSLERYKNELKGFLYFEPRRTKEDKIDFKEQRLCYCSSVPSAVDLAIQCSCKNIFLLGVDHNTIEGKDHFWQFFPKNHQPKAHPPAQGPFSQQKTVFPTNVLAYKALEKFAEFKKIKIYNCNINSDIDVFKKIEFKNIKKYF